MTFKEFYLTEDKDLTDNYIVVYGGRFQPFTPNHYEVYKQLTDKFGKDKVFIATSDKVEQPSSPFNFEEKVEIITKLFDIPKEKIIETQVPYKPVEVFKRFKGKDFAYITVIGRKDAERLTSGKYFVAYHDDKMMYPYNKHGYVYVADNKNVSHDGKVISGTYIRNGIRKAIDSAQRERILENIYGKKNEDVFNMMINRISQSPLNKI